jgi:hypothetical protein
VIINLRVSGDPQAFATSVEKAVHELNPDLPVFSIHKWEASYMPSLNGIDAARRIRSQRFSRFQIGLQDASQSFDEDPVIIGRRWCCDYGRALEQNLWTSHSGIATRTSTRAPSPGFERTSRLPLTSRTPFSMLTRVRGRDWKRSRLASE